MDASYVTYTDNNPCVKMIDCKPNGILHLLDNKIQLGNHNNQAFVDDCVKMHHPKVLALSSFPLSLPPPPPLCLPSSDLVDAPPKTGRDKSSAGYFDTRPLLKHPDTGKPFPNIIVKHFAGEVTYDCEGFIQKSEDKLNADLVTMIKVLPLSLSLPPPPPPLCLPSTDPLTSSL